MFARNSEDLDFTTISSVKNFSLQEENEGDVNEMWRAEGGNI